MPFANTAYFLTRLYWAKLKGCLKVQAMRTEALFFKTLFLVFLSFYIIATGNHSLDRPKRHHHKHSNLTTVATTYTVTDGNVADAVSGSEIGKGASEHNNGATKSGKLLKKVSDKTYEIAKDSIFAGLIISIKRVQH